MHRDRGGQCGVDATPPRQTRRASAAERRHAALWVLANLMSCVSCRGQRVVTHIGGSDSGGWYKRMMPSKEEARGSRGADTVRILTHNLYGRRARWERRRIVLRAGLRALGPDLLTLQETILMDDYDQVADLLGADYHVAHSRAREADGQGIAIASRWPLGAVRELDLNATPRTGDFACTTLLAEITAPDPIGPLLLVNHFPDHRPDHERGRELQAVAAARAVEALVERRLRHVVLAGDFDAEPDAASMRFVAGRQSLEGASVCYRNAWDSAHPGAPGHTFAARNPLVAAENWDWPFRRIDHILVRCGPHGGPTLAIAACALAFAEPVDGIWASDHFAIVADLTVPRRPATAA